MELCTPRLLSHFPQHRSFNPSRPFLFSTPPFFTKVTLPSPTKRGSVYFTAHLPKATTSEETSTSISDKFNGHDEETNTEQAPIDVRAKAIEFLDNLNVKLGSVNPYPILLYGSGTVSALWISSAIVGAIDSIPLVPKVLEVVGLSFTIWFSYRYLIFKKNREELSAKIEELKQEILGSPED